MPKKEGKRIKAKKRGGGGGRSQGELKITKAATTRLNKHLILFHSEQRHIQLT